MIPSTLINWIFHNSFGTLTSKLVLEYSVIVALTGLPIGYSVIVALTGLPIGYSVIVALTGLPIGYSVILTLLLSQINGTNYHIPTGKPDGGGL